MTYVLAGPPAATVEQAAAKVRTGTPVEHLLVCGTPGRGRTGGAERFRAGHVVLATSLALRTAGTPPDSEAMSSAVLPNVRCQKVGRTC
jgi:hypothetical protein